MLTADYLDGRQFGMGEGCWVHRLANIACKIKSGTKCRIDAFVTVTGNVRLGTGVHLSTGSLILGVYGCVLGDYAGMGPGSKILTGIDDVDADCISSFEGSGVDMVVKGGAVRVGDYTRVGANSVIFPGVSIGSGAQIGALTLVNKNVPDNWIYAGIPARPFRLRAKLKYL